MFLCSCFKLFPVSTICPLSKMEARTPCITVLSLPTLHQSPRRYPVSSLNSSQICLTSLYIACCSHQTPWGCTQGPRSPLHRRGDRHRAGLPSREGQCQGLTQAYLAIGCSLYCQRPPPPPASVWPRCHHLDEGGTRNLG